MNQLENMAFVITFTAYSGAMLLYVWYFVSRHAYIGTLASAVTVIGWGANTAALIVRSLMAGRLPLSNGYEFLLAFAWGIVIVYLWFEYRHQLKPLGAFVLPVVWVIMAYVAVEIPAEQKAVLPLMAALRSNWLSIHVATAILSYGAFAVSFGLAVMYLIKERQETAGSDQAIISSLPSAGMLDELCYKTITFGFFFLALVIVSGAIWAEQAWGSYWSWDPKETWSLITWLIYGTYLHARLTYGWRGRRAAVMAIIGFTAVMFTFFGVNYFLAGLHSYA